MALAERLGAAVLTDIKTGATFPTRHALHPFPPSLYVTGGGSQLIRDADVILSLDWIDLGGTLRQACGGEMPRAKVVQCSLDPYIHNGHSMDHQSLPPTDLAMLAPPDSLVAALLDTLATAAAKPGPAWFASALPDAEAVAAPVPSPANDRIALVELARVTTQALAPHRPSYIRLPLGWPGEFCQFAQPQDYIGFDGSGGIGYEIGFAYANFDNATMYPLIVLILLASVAINGVLSRWEQRLLRRRGMR